MNLGKIFQLSETVSISKKMERVVILSLFLYKDGPWKILSANIIPKMLRIVTLNL